MANAITAINKTHQSMVNRAYNHFRKYHNFVNLDGTFDTDKEQSKNDRQQAKSYDLFNECFDELPKREQMNLDKQHKIIHGY
jgi:DNA-directed RNA polymerase specialized sigma24 family protein